jgi:hypothetical protein
VDRLWSIKGVSCNPSIKLDFAFDTPVDSISEPSLSSFIIKHNDGEVGHGGNDEMVTRDSSRVYTNSDLVDITSYDTRSGLDGDSYPQIPVDHLLLGKGKGSGFADYYVSPLGADAGAEIG